MTPGAAQKALKAYNSSLKPFDADYDASTGILNLHYPGDGSPVRLQIGRDLSKLFTGKTVFRR